MVNCPNCGTSNLDNASVCVNCGRSLGGASASSYTPPPPPSVGYGASPSGGVTGANIPNYLWQSIVVTLCCCLPAGIVSIIFAAQVNSKLAQGDIAGAQAASKNAKTWALVGFGVGLVIIVLSMIMNGAIFMQAIREAQANRG
jgi:hypothetical protein